MSDFERAKLEVGERTILLTSWFDDSQQSWRASAPGYSHLSIVSETARVACSSRQAAVNHLREVLARHFAPPSG